MNFKIIIKSVSICLVMSLCFTTFGSHTAFAAQYNSKKNNIISTEYNGKKYGFEQKIKDNGKKYETKVYTNGVLTDVSVTDFNTGKVMDNNVEVGFVKEQWTLDETPLSKSDKSKLANGDMIITPYVISPPYEGYGGGIYKYVRSYVTGFSFLTYAIVSSVTLALAGKALAYIHSLYSEPKFALLIHVKPADLVFDPTLALCSV